MFKEGSKKGGKGDQKTKDKNLGKDDINFRKFAPIFKTLSSFTSDFIKALYKYSKIESKIKIETFSNSIANFVKEISEASVHSKPKAIYNTLHAVTKGIMYFIKQLLKLKSSEVKRFSKLVNSLSHVFNIIIDLFDKIISHEKRYEIALDVLSSIIKVIRKMQMGFIIGALIVEQLINIFGE
jgi:hypothetical protein